MNSRLRRWRSGRRRLAGYSAALLLAAAAQVVRLPLDPPTLIPYITYVPFIVLSAAFGGMRPGLLTTALCILESLHFATEHRGSWVVRDPQSWLGVGTLLSSAVVICYLFERVEKGRRADATSRELGALLNQTNDAVFVWDLESKRITFWDQGAARLYGYPTREALGRYPKEVLRTQFPESLEACLAAAQQADGWRGELVHTTRDRGPITVEGRMSVRQSDDGTLRVIEVTRDISERKRLEQIQGQLAWEKEQRRQTLESIVQNSPICIALLRGPEFTFESVNSAYQALCPGELIVGRTVAEVWPEAAPLVLPLLSVVRDAQTVYHATEMRIPRKRSPEGPPEERYFDFSYVPLLGPSGDVRILVSAIEMTRYKRATEELQKSLIELQHTEEQVRNLAAIVESSDDAIIGKTTEGIITSWNSGAERIYGYAKEEVIGQPISILLPPDNGDDLRQMMDRIGRNERMEHFEATRRCKHGQRVVMSLTISPVKDGSGRVVGVSTIGRDITERKLAEAKILELNEALRTRARSSEEDLESFSYSVSHDLRAPVRHIAGFLALLEDHIGGDLDEAARHYLANVLDSTRLMGVLIDDLLTFSRTGKVEMCEANVCLEDLVQQVQRELTADIHGRKVVWRVEALPEVAADPVLLRLVLVNLLGNAIKYSNNRAEAAIDIGCREAGGEWVFFVRDNGVGFDMRYMHKLFGVFQRLHSADEFEGTGIGLAIVKRIVARHGGRTWAEGAVGQGATFYFSLPKAAGTRRCAIRNEPAEPILATMRTQ
jgi:PAS domain S-box-containing protein